MNIKNMLQPQIEITASSVIWNPLYSFPHDRVVQVYPAKKAPKGTTIVELCKVSFPKYGFVLLFNDDKICIFKYPEKLSSPSNGSLINPLISFITFKTYINYNLYSHPNSKSKALLDIAPEVKSISMNLGQWQKKEHEDEIGKGFSYEIVPYVLTLERQEIEKFLEFINSNLYLSICYYLIGCENIRYFLIEYYKSIEVISNYFANENKMKQKMAPYGFNKNDYNKLKKYANNELEPLDIGRHAPKGKAELFVVNIKRLLEEPKSKDIFTESSCICRQTIEIFLRYLTAENKTII